VAAEVDGLMRFLICIFLSALGVRVEGALDLVCDTGRWVALGGVWGSAPPMETWLDTWMNSFLLH
jgi:hypothetical protein